MRIRPATLDDLPALHRIAERAVWTLLAGRHITHQVAAAARDAQGSVEPELVQGGTYYVLEVDDAIVGGSGWSAGGPFHPPMGAEAERPAGAPRPRADTAVMRASYVDPDWSGRGLGSLLARVTETAAMLAGHRRFEAVCTPMSEAVRRRLGYHVVARVEVPLTGGVGIPMAHMRKELDIAGAPGRDRSAS